MRFVLSFLLYAALVSTEAVYEGKVVQIVDADKVRVVFNNKAEKVISLLDVDAPDRGQPYYAQAYAHLKKACLGKKVLKKFLN